MQPSNRRQLKFHIATVMLSLCVTAVLLWCSLPFARAQSGESGAVTGAAPSRPAPT